MYCCKLDHGFTLIEVIIYIALFGFIISAGVFSAFNIFTSTAQVDMAAKQEIELNFIYKKIEWALGGDITNPTNEFSDNSILAFTRDNQGYEIFLLDGNLVIQNENDVQQLSSSLMMEEIIFTRHTITEPDEIEIVIKTNNETLPPIIYYVRTK